jgi:hypothetical protein
MEYEIDKMAERMCNPSSKSEVWEPIHGFGSPGEFERFMAWVRLQINESRARPVAVERPYGSSYLSETWIKDELFGEVWRIVAPEPPFRGVFLPVARSERVT